MWHTDSSFKRIPGKYSFLHAHAIPSRAARPSTRSSGRSGTRCSRRRRGRSRPWWWSTRCATPTGPSGSLTSRRRSGLRCRLHHSSCARARSQFSHPLLAPTPRTSRLAGAGRAFAARSLSRPPSEWRSGPAPLAGRRSGAEDSRPRCAGSAPPTSRATAATCGGLSRPAAELERDWPAVPVANIHRVRRGGTPTELVVAG